MDADGKLSIRADDMGAAMWARMWLPQQTGRQSQYLLRNYTVIVAAASCCNPGIRAVISAKQTSRKALTILLCPVA
ncbi:hypothetical protein [Paracoccus alkanivorans]|uniref:Uncharacterized protein n=1 Tax=Paracoccus alkanivorans TaxID=2116655 RepID=A0A3M0MJ64_9RHOB|nr:hypothetical protein [Paracoccus alkanivorans]RMC37812.1 hypothetical protein C9E81_03495 [Paracoccus alkanivorans]